MIMEASQRKAFEGVRILDFTHYLAGPFSTYQLALQGADVIKVEPLEGDSMRSTPLDKTWSEAGLSPSWMAVNVNKRSLTLDFTKPQAAEIVKRLIPQIDVVVENFRPGVLERRGMGWSTLSKINPRLIYCGVSGFGHTGPEKGTASFDGKIQAMSGLMSMTGEAVNGPMRAGFAAADVTAGITAAFAIATALFQRTHTGMGQFVDVAMLDSLLSFLSGQVAEYTVLGVRHGQLGNGSVSRKPTANRFRCGGGYIVLAALTDKQFDNLLRAIGREEAISDPRFANWDTRIANEPALREIIEAGLASDDPKVWEKRLTAADVPCASVHTIADILQHPQVVHRGLVQETQTPLGPVKLAGAGFRLEHGNGGIDKPMATPGQHTDEVLALAGYDAAQIAALHADKVV
jgi:crotonobetainyl-CoA:carnitine CoA-transferase CaiB-like acyl-CoA transferase